MERILSLVALLIGVLSIPWLKLVIERKYRELHSIGAVAWFRRVHSVKYAGARAIQEGSYANIHPDFMICEWLHEIRVNSRGDTQTTVDCTLVNISEEPKDDITFTVYAETNAIILHGWVGIGGVKRDLVAEEWDSARG